MLWAAIVGSALIAVTTLTHWAVLRTLAQVARRCAAGGVARLLLLVFTVIAAHTLEIAAYAAGYYLVDDVLGLGHISGEFSGRVFDYLYYSTVSYTSLGLGDVYPHGPARLLTGIEALNGLFLIGWSAMFTYPAFERSCSVDREDRTKRS